MDTSNNSAEVDSFYDEVGNLFFNDSKLHDVEFIVGEQKEKIKAVRLLLINQSRTWWSMLSKDSPLAEQGEIKLPDIDPEVFNLLLKHSYGGLESLQSLSDDIVMKLCYCANKYFMASLMKKIATRLEPKGVKDLFPALHCLVYYNLQGVEEAVKEIVQNQTAKILVHPHFLECDIDSVTYICKQEILHCDSELTLWKAVVKWAKHKAQTDEGPQLRKWISPLLPHIRLTTLSGTDLKDHVLSLNILICEEIVSICKSDSSLNMSLCAEKSSRCIREKNLVRTVDVTQNADFRDTNYSTSKTSTSCLIIKSKDIELQSLVIRGINMIDIWRKNYKEMLFVGLEGNTSLSVNITRITNAMNNTSDEQPMIIKLDPFTFYYGQKTTVPTLVNGKGVSLQANSKYKVKLTFSDSFPCWCEPDCVSGHDFDDVTFHCSLLYHNGFGLTTCHILKFTYRVADD